MSAPSTAPVATAGVSKPPRAPLPRQAAVANGLSSNSNIRLPGPIAPSRASCAAPFPLPSSAGDQIAATPTKVKITVVATGVPVGWGEPVYGRLDADLASAMMGINAVKGVEIGAGFASVGQRGTEHSDEMTPDGFLSNNAGGILGGISTGQDVVVTIAVKPTSSIRLDRHSIDIDGQPVVVNTHGRHDPCVGIRAAPIAEAMLALVLIDHALRHRAQNADVSVSTPRLAAAAPPDVVAQHRRAAPVDDPDPDEA